MARAVEEITASGGVQVEEDTGHDDDLLLKTGLEEVETVGNGLRETLKVEPAGGCQSWRLRLSLSKTATYR